MRRIQYHRYGGPEELRLEEAEEPAPSRDEVRVRVKAAGVNPMDWGIRSGSVRMLTGRRFPRGLGHDFAGVIEAVGSDAKRFEVGDEVFGATGLKDAGAFADAVVVEERHVMRKPTSLPFEQAAALTIVSATAWTALVDRARLRAGQTVVITGCLGGVGRAAVQIAVSLGASVSGSCDGARREEARELGVDDVVDYRTFDPASYSRRFDVVFDTATALSMSQSGGMLNAGGMALHLDVGPFKLLRCLLSRRHKMVIASSRPETMAAIARAAADGVLVPQIGWTVPLADAIPAITQLETSGSPKGKLVIVP